MNSEEGLTRSRRRAVKSEAGHGPKRGRGRRRGRRGVGAALALLLRVQVQKLLFMLKFMFLLLLVDGGHGLVVGQGGGLRGAGALPLGRRVPGPVVARVGLAHGQVCKRGAG